MTTIAYERGGSGAALILIHGLGSHRAIWNPVLEGLRRERDVIAIDLPGFGQSPMPATPTPAGVGTLVPLIGEFLAELGIEHPHVAGNSLGGLTVLEMARRGMVGSATALSPAGFASRAEHLAARLSLRISQAAARRLRSRADRMMRSSAGRRIAFSGTIAHPERIPPEEAAGHLRAFADAPWFVATMRSVGPMCFTGGTAIDVPVTIGWGRKDRLLLPRQARRAAAEIPRARVEMMDDCGHAPMYDDPALVTRLILETSAPR